MKKGVGYATKDVSGSIADVDSLKGVVVSYPSTFDVIDAANERVKKGAFARTIKSWGPEGKMRTKALFDHKPYYLIGRPLELSEDAKGLRAVTQISKTAMGKDILTLIADQVITEQSIGYEIVKEEKSEHNLRDLTELKLYEYSFLAWGMNEDTPIIGVKGLGLYGESLSEQMGRMEKALRNGLFETEEVPTMLELALKQWQAQLPSEEKTERIVIPSEPETKLSKEFTENLAKISDTREMWLKYEDIYSAHYTSVVDVLYGEGDPSKRLGSFGDSLNQYKQELFAWTAKFLEVDGFDEKDSRPEMGLKLTFPKATPEIDLNLVKDAMIYLQSLAGSSDSDSSSTRAKSDSIVPSDDSEEAFHSGEIDGLVKQLKELYTPEEAEAEKSLTDFFKELGL